MLKTPLFLQQAFNRHPRQLKPSSKKRRLPALDGQLPVLTSRMAMTHLLMAQALLARRLLLQARHPVTAPALRPAMILLIRRTIQALMTQAPPLLLLLPPLRRPTPIRQRPMEIQRFPPIGVLRTTNLHKTSSRSSAESSTMKREH